MSHEGAKNPSESLIKLSEGFHHTMNTMNFSHLPGLCNFSECYFAIGCLITFPSKSFRCYIKKIRDIIIRYTEVALNAF